MFELENLELQRDYSERRVDITKIVGVYDKMPFGELFSRYYTLLVHADAIAHVIYGKTEIDIKGVSVPGVQSNVSLG